MNKYTATLVITLLLLNTDAKSQLLSISADVDTNYLRIGEQTRFELTVEQPADLYVLFPAIRDTLSKSIEVLDVDPPDTVAIDDQRLIIKQRYRITSFEAGEHVIAPLPFVFFMDEQERELYSSRVRLKVVSPDVDMSEGIFDIKDPFTLPYSAAEIIKIALPFIIIALLLFLLYRYYRRRKEKKSYNESAKPAEPAHRIALRELKNLKDMALWRDGRVKEFYTRLTEIIRIYIERQFGIMAMELTTDDVIKKLQSEQLFDKEIVNIISELLSIADLVKFAKAKPSDDDHYKSLDLAFRFVKETFSTALPGDEKIEEKTGVSIVNSVYDE